MRTAVAFLVVVSCSLCSSTIAQGQVADPDSFICEFPEVYPELIGGRDSLQATVRWPDTQDDIVCTVFVGFIVEADGAVSDPKIYRGCRPDLDAAALDAILRVRFRPGTRYMKPVAMRMAWPVQFDGSSGRN